jgi:DNA (cytosine-5)-methyltransferase 1
LAFKTVDLFAGPGGLSEGFSSVRDRAGNRVFDIALSVEKEPSAFETLRLRSFFRQFLAPPDAYYDYVAGRIPKGRLVEAYPREWASAEAETVMLELGTPGAQELLDPVLDRIRSEATDGTLVIGGPPCQAYSLVGRARNRGVRGYEPAADHRHFLYKEYIRILNRLEPVAFVMENVKGMLSSKVHGERVIDRILADLRAAGGGDGYTLLPLVTDSREDGSNVVRSEDYGIPQCRHRVILLGIRADILIGRRASLARLPVLRRSKERATVADVLADMPPLRSGLSRVEDSPEAWREAVVEAFDKAAVACRQEGPRLKEVARRLSQYARLLSAQRRLPPRSKPLARWLLDRRVSVLPNHESRGHMEDDLARYAFAATFAEVHERSAKAAEFPSRLAPDHRNWETGRFADRFRVQVWHAPSTTVTSHISKDGHYFIHPDPMQCRSLTVREAARLQTFPDNYFFEGNRTQQYVQVGNAVPPLLAKQIGELVAGILTG